MVVGRFCAETAADASEPAVKLRLFRETDKLDARKFAVVTILSSTFAA